MRNAVEPPAYRRNVTTAGRLMAMTFPPPRWAVPGVIPEGLTVLAGSPKVGKSWLVLDVALAVASGGAALGGEPVQPGPVLYLALEDPPRRLQDRIRLLWGDGPVPDDLHLAREWPSGQMALEWIEAWLTDHPGARLVVVDVLRLVKPTRNSQGNSYDDDYSDVRAFKALADRHSVAIVLVHHVRKAAADHWADTISGTNGVAGAADTTAVLTSTSGQADGVLHIRGRDVEERDLTLAKAGPAWTLVDVPAEVANLGDRAAAITTYVLSQPLGVTVADVSNALGLDPRQTRTYLDRLVASGRLHRPKRGTYAPLSPAPVSPVSSESFTPGEPLPGVSPGVSLASRRTDTDDTRDTHLDTPRRNNHG